MNRTQRILALGSALDYANPNETGKILADIILFLLRNIPPQQRTNAIRKMIIKIRVMRSDDISKKKMRPYSSMGTSVSLLKNTLAGRDAKSVRDILDAVIRNLAY